MSEARKLVRRLETETRWEQSSRTHTVPSELFLAVLKSLRAEKPSEPAASFCPQCGFNVECDEDGCCVTCGATAMGEAVKALRVFSVKWRQSPTEADDE